MGGLWDALRKKGRQVSGDRDRGGESNRGSDGAGAPGVGGGETYEMAVAPVGKNPLFPLPWMIPDRSSPSRVRFRRFAP